MATNIKPRRKLGDLYKRGVEVRFDPEEGGEVGPFDSPPATEDIICVWVGPPSPLQRDMAMREASAARARAIIAVKRDENSEEHLVSKNFVIDMGENTLVDYILLGSQEERRVEAMRDVLSDEEWKDFATLQDAMRQLEEGEINEDDPEYIAVMEKDREYGRQVSERFTSLTGSAREVLMRQSRADLERKAMEKRAELIGSERFMHAFELWMTYYAVRDFDNHSLLYYEAPRQFQESEDIIQDTIKEALKTFIQDPSEAKNWQRAASGSTSSVQPNDPEISEVSIPETVTV